MAQSQVTYTDKVENGGATNEGKCLATDLNELKTVVNANATDADADLFNRSFDGFNSGGTHNLFSGDLNTIFHNSRYLVASVATNKPIGGFGFVTTMINTSGEFGSQQWQPNDGTTAMYIRSTDGASNWGIGEEIAEADDFVPIDTTEIKIGTGAGATSQGADTVAVGNGSGNNTQEIGAVAVGLNAGNSLQSSYAVSVGSSAGTTSQGDRAIAIGVQAGNDTQGNDSIAIGREAGKTTLGVNSVAIGQFAGRTSLGTQCVAVGNQAGQSATGNFNVFLGSQTGINVTGTNNVFLGQGAGSSATNEINSSCLGNDSQVTATNQVQLGNSATTTYAYGAVQDRSDERDKADIEGIHLGLDFIDALTPRSYKFDYREDYREHTTEMQEVITQDEGGNNVVTHEEVTVPDTRELGEITHDGTHKRSRLHCGLVAQEVKQVMEDLGVDFGGYQDHSINGGQDVLSIGYGELIAPMIKAIQELKAEIDILKGQ